jgi:hypothetical protein
VHAVGGFRFRRKGRRESVPLRGEAPNGAERPSAGAGRNTPTGGAQQEEWNVAKKKAAKKAAKKTVKKGAKKAAKKAMKKTTKKSAKKSAKKTSSGGMGGTPSM